MGDDSGEDYVSEEDSQRPKPAISGLQWLMLASFRLRRLGGLK